MRNTRYEIRYTNSFPQTRIQKLIGERMLKSKLTKPCFYIKSKADITELMAIRGKLSKASGVKITSNAFLIRALALAVDRRVADEVYVVRFLNSIAEQLQNLRELV